MHILVTTDTLGGVWTYTRELVTGLLQRGIRVTLVSFGNIPGEQETNWMEGQSRLDFRPTAFRLEWMQDSAEDLRSSAAYLESVIAETAPDILHLSQFCYGALDTRVPKLVVGHSDVVGWFQAVHGTAKDSQWLREYREMVVAGLQGADLVAAPSRWMLESLQQNYGVPVPSRVIVNGRSPSLFNPWASKDDLLLSAGRLWDLGKNAALLTQVHLPGILYLAGDNHHPDHGSETFASRDARLVLRGVLGERQMQHLLSRARVYVATSQYEPFGLSLVEAALSRCAIIASDIDSFRELWGDNVLYFESNNPASLEAGLERLYQDRELAASYGKLAYEHALRNYRSEQMVDVYLSAYVSLMSQEALAA